MFTTKINLNSSKIEQCSNEILNLSGCTQIYGQFSILNPTGFTSPFNAGIGKIWTSDAVGNGSWQASSGGTGSTGTITGATNGLSTSGASIVLGGTLNASLTCLPTSVEFAGAGTKFLIGTGTCDPLANFLGGKLYIGRSCTECDSYAFIGSKTHASGGVVGSFIQTTSGAGICSWFCNGSVTRTTILCTNGLSYGADYSACYTDRSLVDRAYVLSQVSSGATFGIGWSNLARGTTVAGCGTPVSGGTICCNTIYGVCAGVGLTTGYNNVAVGTCALKTNTIGHNNISIGACALYNNTTGIHNVAVGTQALYYNLQGQQNTAMGYQALYNNTGGTLNIGIGVCALFCNTVTTRNIGIGTQALAAAVFGTDNVAIGTSAMGNAVGPSSTCSARLNVAIGTESLYSTTCGCYNVAIGDTTLRATTTGIFNVAIGGLTLTCNTTGCFNTAIGTQALWGNTTGSRNVAIGEQAGYTSIGSDKLYIANCAICTLIYGDFASKCVNINGSLCVSGLTASTVSNICLNSTCGNVNLNSIGNICLHSYGNSGCGIILDSDTGDTTICGVPVVINTAHNFFYLGDKNTDGSWRFDAVGATCCGVNCGGSLEFQKRISGSWVTCGVIAG